MMGLSCAAACTPQASSTGDVADLRPHFGEGEEDYYLADPLAGHVHQPDARREFQWVEHPLGRIVQATNNMGFREDGPTRTEKQQGFKRVLVTGDSHVDGVVYNEESFPNRLEAMWDTSARAPSVEVINAGAGYYGPQNYLGVLRRSIHLAPDAFIATLYTGNDLLDAVRIEAENGRLAVPERKDDYYQDLWTVDGTHPGFTGQVINQVKFFRSFPTFRDTAVAITLRTFAEMREVCRSHRIAFAVVLLPTALDVEPERDGSRIAEVLEMMGMTWDDLRAGQAMVDQVEQGIAAMGIPIVDLRKVWSGPLDGPYYWRADLHLNDRGHAAAARAIFPILQELLR